MTQARETLDEVKARCGQMVGRRPTEISGMTRQGLAQLFGALGYRTGAELGVASGVYAEVLCREVPGLCLTCVDTWDYQERYRPHVTAEEAERQRLEAVRRLAPYSVSFMKTDILSAATYHADRSLDFVYLDARHDLAGVIADLVIWTPKVREGGIIAGHDYRRPRPSSQETAKDWATQHHVIAALTSWTRSYRIDPWFVCGVDGEERESARSWFWVQGGSDA